MTADFHHERHRAQPATPHDAPTAQPVAVH
jgi:hypothetical protein